VNDQGKPKIVTFFEIFDLKKVAEDAATQFVFEQFERLNSYESGLDSSLVGLIAIPMEACATLCLCKVKAAPDNYDFSLALDVER
jgi:hypothetical protein